MQLNDASVYKFYVDSDMSTLSSTAPLLPGKYLLRFWRNGTVIAQGYFTVVH